jgi:ribA/ribD-fused uncharacterized protein
MLKTDTHLFFWKEKFSNWFFSPIVFTDPFSGASINFTCTEQAFMYFKAITFDDYETANKIIAAQTPKEQKELGRQVKNFNQGVWDDEKFACMYWANAMKYTQHENLKAELIATTPLKLVEASPVDKIWGIGLAEDNPLALDEATWQGQNLLGECLTQLRNDIIAGNVVDIKTGLLF